MAIFRKIHITYWSDPFISELKQDEKLFYIYLLTNPNTSQCGIYEITKKQISFDLGYTIDRVSILLKYFISKNKIRYNETTFEIAIKNWGKYNDSTSPKVKVLVNKELSKVKDKVLIEYLYSIDTHSQQEEEPEQEIEGEEEPKKPKGFTPPTIDEVKQYFLDNGYTEQSAVKSFNYYDVANWSDSKGNKIKNWKQKMQGVWFKDENKQPAGKGVYNPDLPAPQPSGRILQ